MNMADVRRQKTSPVDAVPQCKVLSKDVPGEVITALQQPSASSSRGNVGDDDDDDGDDQA